MIKIKITIFCAKGVTSLENKKMVKSLLMSYFIIKQSKSGTE